MKTTLISYAQNFEDVMLWRALNDVANGFYIDIGAHDPLIDSVSRLFYERGWRGIHIEPVSAYCDALRQDRPDELVIQAAVSAVSGSLKFYELGGISTANPDIAHSHRLRGYQPKETVVNSITLEQVFSFANDNSIHWLKIDVEGFEKEVLSSWGKSDANPWIIVIESTLPLTQQESHREWEIHLIERGYSFIYFDGLNRFYLAQDRQHLRKYFQSPPNVFDNFALSGKSSATFCDFVKSSLIDQAKEDNQKTSNENKFFTAETEKLKAHLFEIKNNNDVLKKIIQIKEILISRLNEDIKSSLQDRIKSESDAAAIIKRNEKLYLQWKKNLLLQQIHQEKENNRLNSIIEDQAKKIRNIELIAQRDISEVHRALQDAISREQHSQASISNLLNDVEAGQQEISRREKLATESMASNEKKLNNALNQIEHEHTRQKNLLTEIAESKSTINQLSGELKKIRESFMWRFIYFLGNLSKAKKESNASNQLFSIYKIFCKKLEAKKFFESHSNSPSTKSSIMQNPTKISDLLELNDISFVWKTYQTVLRREPDREGMKFYLAKVREGFSKESIIADIASSKEGQSLSSDIPDLQDFMDRQRQNKHWLSRWFKTESESEKERTINRVENLLSRNQEVLEKKMIALEAALHGTVRKIGQIQINNSKKSNENFSAEAAEIYTDNPKSVIDGFQFSQSTNPQILINELQRSIAVSAEAEIFKNSKKD